VPSKEQESSLGGDAASIRNGSSNGSSTGSRKTRFSNIYHIFFPWVQLQQTCGLGNVEEADERSLKKQKRRSTATVRAVLQEEPSEELLEEFGDLAGGGVKAQQLELGLSSCRLRKPWACRWTVREIICLSRSSKLTAVCQEGQDRVSLFGGPS
jgi:hypothetical protein